jgi:hypothetical protein
LFTWVTRDLTWITGLSRSDLDGAGERKAIGGFKLSGNPLPKEFLPAFLLKDAIEAALEVKFFAAFDQAVFTFTGFFELCNQHRGIDVGIRQRFDLFSQLTIFSPKGFEFGLKGCVVPEFRHWG